MPVKNEQLNFAVLIILLFFALAAIFFLVRPISVSAFLPYILIAAPIIFLVALFNTDIALIILIFSMLLSPELILGDVIGRSIVLRLDDIFIFLIFFGWISKMAIKKELGFLRVSPLNKLIQIYFFVYVVATLVGIIRGFITFKSSIFYLIKYFEYFLVYFMVVNCLKDKKQIKRFIFYVIIVASLTCVYAWYERFLGLGRVSAPFEGKGGEANTLGGYLLLIMMICTGLLLNLKSLNL